jgi:hypothetical protein
MLVRSFSLSLFAHYSILEVFVIVIFSVKSEKTVRRVGWNWSGRRRRNCQPISVLFSFSQLLFLTMQNAVFKSFFDATFVMSLF